MTAKSSFYELTGVDYGTLLPPVNTALPIITGTPTVGEVLSVSNGLWNNSPTSFVYQWKRNGGTIGGATSATYTVVHADAGFTLSCTVTASNFVGNASADSVSTASVIEAPSNSAAPVITGTPPPTEGNTLGVTPGTWTGTPAPTLTYQWLQDGTPIGGATATTYVVAHGDIGHNISVQETATNSAGLATATSSSVGPVVAAGGSYSPSLDFSDGRNSQYTSLLV